MPSQELICSEVAYCGFEGLLDHKFQVIETLNMKRDVGLQNGKIRKHSRDDS